LAACIISARGYEALDAKLSSLGAQIERVKDTASA